MSERIVIRGGRLVDPALQRDGIHDLYIDQGRILAIDHAPEGFQAERTIDARGLIVCPGFIDLCARLREPGFEHKADLTSETRAAAAAGITTLICPPDTEPVIDEPAVARLVKRRADRAGHARVLPLGALTQGLRGEQLAELAALREAGCVGFSNGLWPVDNPLVLRRVMEYAATFDLTIFLSPQERTLTKHGCAHDGLVAGRLGLAGIPTAAETAQLARDLELVAETGVRAHFGRLSSARAVEMIAEAQARGLPVSADTCAHQLHLSELDLGRFDSQLHVLPPLRTLRDRDALRSGLAFGTLSVLCSDHQPHELDAKLNPYIETEAGISALATLLPLGLQLVDQRVLSLTQLIERLCSGPARLLGLDSGHLAVGAVADVCIFDPQHAWILNEQTSYSRGHNSPFWGWELRGKVRHTLLGGRVVHSNGSV